MTRKTYEEQKMEMPEQLEAKVANLSSFQRKYCEYRAKGLKQWEAAMKAGSKSQSKAGAGRVGWNTEQQDGVEEYISFLLEKRAHLAMVDQIEIIDKLRESYDEAMAAGKFSDANKATELLGNMIGAFSNSGSGKSSSSAGGSSDNTSKNNIDAFKEEDGTTDERLKKIRSLIQEEKGKKS